MKCQSLESNPSLLNHSQVFYLLSTEALVAKGSRKLAMFLVWLLPPAIWSGAALFLCQTKRVWVPVSRENLEGSKSVPGLVRQLNNVNSLDWLWYRRSHLQSPVNVRPCLDFIVSWSWVFTPERNSVRMLLFNTQVVFIILKPLAYMLDQLKLFKSIDWPFMSLYSLTQRHEVESFENTKESSIELLGCESE